MSYENGMKMVPVDGRSEAKMVPQDTRRVQTVDMLRQINELGSEAVAMAEHISVALYGHRNEEQDVAKYEEPCCMEAEILLIGNKVRCLTNVLKEIIDSLGI